MKLSSVIFMLALLTTTLAGPFNIFRRELEGKELDEKTVKKIEHEVDQELEIGEELAEDIAGKEHKKEGDISVCVIQLFEDAGHSFEKVFVDKDKDDGKEEGEEEKDGGKGGEVLRDLRSSLVRRLLRFKRSPSGGEEKRSGALEKFFQCMKKQLGDFKGEGEGHHQGGLEGGSGKGESGSGKDEGGEEGVPKKRELIKPVKMHKRKIRKHIA